ncbi:MULTISPECIES: polysaccharide deacetylase family protein [Clostridium]|uniref:Polysaccharide deacetylase family protein n=1 Tax=Clostridium cibarium TaxID=2762247 RepID=A0ABR8PRF1_9CLOT|nr:MULTISPECIES: polysaccharide deacetylase family protein [Clostridium]MBD7910755.1 polysaccharide deacetylase family protein [Clostridium cibarium]
MSTIYNCFPGGKHKVLTMSYDDGRNGDRKLIEIFNKYNIKGTFHLNSGLIEKYEPLISDAFGKRIPRKEIKELYKGHEVSCHTLTHPTIERCPMTNVINEVLEDRKELESLVGYTVRGLSYPNGSYTDEIKNMLHHVGIEYSRIVGNSENFAMPKDFYEWKATCHHNHDLLKYADEFISLNKTQYLYMFYVWGHSYEFDRDNNWNLMEEFCKKVGNREDTWYATNIEIVDYLNVCRNLKYSADGSFVYNPSIQTAWISVDKVIYQIKGGEQVNFK